jgi:ribosomal protein L14
MCKKKEPPFCLQKYDTAETGNTISVVCKRAKQVSCLELPDEKKKRAKVTLGVIVHERWATRRDPNVIGFKGVSHRVTLKLNYCIMSKISYVVTQLGNW